MSAVITAILADLSEEKLQELLAALEAERAHAVNWWTYLNEMRARRHLPDWVFKQLVGSEIDFDNRKAKEQVVNLLLFGKENVVSSSRLALINASIDAINAAEGYEDLGQDKAEVAQ